MKKGIFLNRIKKEIRNKAFDKLQLRKKPHPKVENVEHNEIKIQKYLKPNKESMNKEIAQLIFKLRCWVTEAKVNLKGTYDYLKCRACHKEEENQKHILLCPVLKDNRSLEEIKYEKVYNGTESKIAKRFKENFKIL